MTRRPAPTEPTVDQGPARALIYLRVSTKEQATMGGEAEGYSIPAQREACLRKTSSLDAEVVSEFIDAGESARSSARPQLQRMLTYIQEHDIDYLIVHKIDRLARNRADDVEISLALKAAEVQLVSCTENIDDTPSGALMHAIMSGIAEFYSRNLAQEVMKGLTQKVKGGGTIGRVPPGYLNVTHRINGREVRTVEIDPDRAEHVRWAFKAYATGDYTLLRLLDELEARGMTITASASLPERPVTRSTLQRMLRNTYYLGYVNWQGVQHPGNHEPIISRELFYEVQAVLDAHRTGEKDRRFPHYLRGSVFCGACGSRLCFDQKTNRHGSTYQYFFCVGRHQKRTDCVRRYVAVHDIEEKIEAKYRTLRLHPKYAELLHTLLSQDLEHLRSGAEHSKRIASRRLQKLGAQRQKLLDAYYADSMPMDLFKVEQDRITKEIERSETEQARADLTFEKIAQTLARCLAFVQHCDELYRDAPPKLRRQLNQAFFEKLYVHENGEVEAHLAEPFNILLHPHLVVETEEQVGERSAKGPELALAVDIDPMHRDREWTNGAPTWLRDGQWWDRISRWHYFKNANRPRRTVSAEVHSTPVLLGLGSKQSYLAEGVGFEPTVTCPTHAFQACRFGRSRTPPGEARGSYRARSLLPCARGPC